MTLLALSMACGILLLHKLNYGHNDIKPHNFLLNSDGSARIIDYGSVQEFGSVIGFETGITPKYCLSEARVSGAR